MNGRRKRLQLYRIQNSDTVWVEEQTEVANETVKFFQNQFTEDSFPEDFELLENIPKLINAEQNENMNRSPDEAEVKAAVFYPSGESSSEPDGFMGLFCQSAWEIIKEDTIVVHAFMGGQEPPRFVSCYSYKSGSDT